MSKKVQYPNGYIGVASDKVAAILEKKGAAKIVEGAPPAPPAPPPSVRAAAIKKAEEKKLATPEALAKMSDADLAALIKDK